jgi:hypothetical protein
MRSGPFAVKPDNPVRAWRSSGGRRAGEITAAQVVALFWISVARAAT